MIPNISFVARQDGIVDETALTSKRAAEIFLKQFPDDGREHCGVLLLSGSCHVLGFHLVGIGDASEVPSAPSEIFRPALLVPACSQIICAHTHPSGIVKPSRNDRKNARAMVLAGRLLSIGLLDYLVLTHRAVSTGQSAYFSFDEKCHADLRRWRQTRLF